MAGQVAQANLCLVYIAARICQFPNDRRPVYKIKWGNHLQQRGQTANLAALPVPIIKGSSVFPLRVKDDAQRRGTVRRNWELAPTAYEGCSEKDEKKP
jgi:hypothetical protein